MTIYEDTTFESQRVDLDGNEYERCTFRSCELVYSGGVPPVLVDNTMSGCQWQFDGAAGRTIAFMQALYHGGGEGARRLVEETIENMMRGTL